MTDQLSLLSPQNDGFQTHALNDHHHILSGTFPYTVETADFDAIWALHPAEYSTFQIHGREVKTPRWQQAYGADYAFSGAVSHALDVPPLLSPFLQWCQETFDPALNGMLLNWYDGAKGHYIGKHRDSTQNMIQGAPIITISLGETRTFRMRPWKETPCREARGYIDFKALDRSVFVIPYDTNLRWTHEIPPTKKAVSQRISITVRAFHTT